MSKDMKLIMERFRKSLNEMPTGIMPVSIGAATPIGSATEKAKEELGSLLDNMDNLFDTIRKAGYYLCGTDHSQVENEVNRLKIDKGDLFFVGDVWLAQDVAKVIPKLLQSAYQQEFSRDTVGAYKPVKNTDLRIVGLTEVIDPGKETKAKAHILMAGEIIVNFCALLEAFNIVRAKIAKEPEKIFPSWKEKLRV